MGVNGGAGGRVLAIGSGVMVLTTVTTNVATRVGLGRGELVGAGPPGGAGGLGVAGRAVPVGEGWVATGGVGVGSGEMGERKGSSVGVGKGEMGVIGENMASGGVMVAVGVADGMETGGA